MANADTIRTADGISCSFDADESPYEVSLYAENGALDEDSTAWDSNTDQTTVGVQFTYKFGTPDRLDCGKLYNLELRSKEARVKELEAKLEALETVNAATWN